MTDDKLIAQQARRIADLEEWVAMYRKIAVDIRAHLYCIGGPLNDNVDGYTPQQLRPFRAIGELVQGIGEPDEGL